jgi:hypothetical protein
MSHAIPNQEPTLSGFSAAISRTISRTYSSTRVTDAMEESVSKKLAILLPIMPNEQRAL